MTAKESIKMGAKALLCAAAVASVATQAYAIPAYPGLIKARQADGSELTVRRIGDERAHMLLTEDGYPLVYNVASRNYEYALMEGSAPVSAGIAATEVGHRSPEALSLLGGIDRDDVMRRFEAGWEEARRTMLPMAAKGGDDRKRIVKISDVPTIGQHDVLVILVDFNDKKFTDNEETGDPVEYYDRFFHKDGFSDYGAKGSAHEYYVDGSCGLYDPQFVVLGPVLVSGGYGDYAGSNGVQYVHSMVAEAVRLADEAYDIDFSVFDTDGDGKVDNVYCLYAGYGQADSYVSDSIWPHSYDMSSKNAEFEVDGVTIDRYTVSQQVNGQTDLPVGIGTFVHEFGHVLGLADHYNNSNSLGNPINNVGNWDLMSSGSYNDDQNCPPTMSAFERYSLGWAEPAELDVHKPGAVEMTPYIESGQCLRVSVSKGDTEYFLIENRQRRGWDEFLPGHGVLVWHIHEDQVVWDNNTPNGDQNHQRVDIVEAANHFTSSGDSSDTFPGSMNVTRYKFKDWSDNTVFGFEWVAEEEDGTCWFLLSDTGYVLPSPEGKVDRIMGTSAVFSWEKSELADTYSVSLHKDGEELKWSEHNSHGEVAFDGLQPETDYLVRIMASLGSLKSETAEIPFTTLPLQIEEKKAEVIGAADVRDESFTARWKVIPEADDYVVTLYTGVHDGEGLLCHGFDDFSTSNPNLPEGWSITDKQGRNESDFGQAAPSIRLRDDDAQLVAAVPGEKIDEVSFWCQANKAGLVLTVEKNIDGEWSEAWRYAADRKREFTQSLELGGVDAVRFTITREEGITGGFYLLDDVALSYVYDRFGFDREIFAGSSFSEAGGICRLSVEGIEPGLMYGYSVRGLLGDRESMESDIMKVEENSESIVTIHPSTNFAKDEVYNLQGIRIRGDRSSLPSGIYIINGRKTVVK